MATFPVPPQQPTVTTFPDGNVLTSSALTIQTINPVLQAITAQMLGISGQPTPYYNVRISWQTLGEIAQKIDEDICFVRAIEVGGNYERQRNFLPQQTQSPTPLGTWTYTRIWEAQWTHYGPNSFDNARLVRSCLFLDQFARILRSFNLFTMMDIPNPLRAPELFQAQWWERVDLRVRMYEGVQETLSYQSPTSTEIIIEDASGILDTIEVQA